MNENRKARAPLHKLPDLWRHDAKNFADESEAPVALGYADELEAALREQHPTIEDRPACESNPAGDGGRHVVALREMRDTGDVSDWQAMEAALDAAIAALSGDGRSGEACPHCAAYRLAAEVANRRAARWRDLNAATPQQPPPAGQASPVGVTDAVRERDKLWCTAIVANLDSAGPRLMLDAEKVLHYVNTNRPDKDNPPAAIHQQAAPSDAATTIVSCEACGSLRRHQPFSMRNKPCSECGFFRG